MSAILGVSALFHDSAAALLIDGEVVAAVAEERLSRKKGDAALPKRAIAWCLAEAGITGDALDAVVFHENPVARASRVFVDCFRNFPESFRQFPVALREELGSKLWVLDDLATAVGAPREKVHPGDHHVSHAAYAFYASGADDAAVLTVDGVGERTSTAGYEASRNGGLSSPLFQTDFPHSLGLFYAAFTALLGFEVNEGEYKFMGLAAFGDPRFKAEVAKLAMVMADGSVQLGRRYFAYETGTSVGYAARMIAEFGEPRQPGTPWELSGARDRRYADLAASVQEVLEERLLELAKILREKTTSNTLCISGGVALNAVAIGRLVRESGFENVFVPPGADDAGSSIGAAYNHYAQTKGVAPKPLRNAFLGPAVDRQRAAALAEAFGLSIVTSDAPEAYVAHAIAAGKIVALATGRAEFGPRALGHRSLLAPPGPASVREALNRAVKHREPFRPFAPLTRDEDALRWFGAPPDGTTRFMTGLRHVPPVPNGYPEDALAAVTHIDGTARLQTVGEGFVYRVLGELAALGLPPIVLNTSLNGRREPICTRAEDVVAFFRDSQVDGLVVENLIITRR
jgi:carbamoyltransferase